MPRIHPTFASVLALFLAGFTLPGCGESPPKPAAKPSVAADEQDYEPEKPALTASDLRQRLKARDVARFTKTGNQFVEAYLAESGVTDLTPLKDHPLKLLDLTRTPVTDLSRWPTSRLRTSVSRKRRSPT
jgi:hypothetical protein